MKTETTELLRPPQGYPGTSWETEGTYAVDPSLRADYAEQAGLGVGSPDGFRGVSDTQKVTTYDENGNPDVHVVSYAEWAHIERRGAARRAQASREANAQWEREETADCILCGVHRDRLLMRTLTPTPDVTVTACVECAPVLATELRSAQVMPSGEPRGEAARQLAARLMAGQTLGPLELRAVPIRGSDQVEPEPEPSDPRRELTVEWGEDRATVTREDGSHGGSWRGDS